MTTLRERLTPQIITDLTERKRTNREVADELGVNESYLSTIFNQLAKKKRGDVAVSREAARKLVESRRALRIREAKKVIAGRKTLESAAKTANCSERTMRRYVEKVAPQEPDEVV